jgi:hypothetical protein
MHEAVRKMLAGYELKRLDDHFHALREILQEVALLGLWRSKFFEKAACCGGTALRILHGLDRFSEDMDFSLLRAMKDFSFSGYSASLKKEIESFGFAIRVEEVKKVAPTAVHSTFFKADTCSQLLVIETDEEIVKAVPAGKILKIRLDIDTDPPAGFETESRYLLKPVPFAVRAYTLPDLFAGKMHAVLCRRWKRRVKGRDWYDLVWYAAHHPELHLAHLEQHMRRSCDWQRDDPLTADAFRRLLAGAIDDLNVAQAKNEVLTYIRDPGVLSVWSREFFHDVASRIRLV